MNNRQPLFKFFSVVMVVAMLLPNVALAAGLPPLTSDQIATDRPSAADPQLQSLFADRQTSDETAATPMTSRAMPGAKSPPVGAAAPTAPVGRVLFAPAIGLGGNPATRRRARAGGGFAGAIGRHCQVGRPIGSG